MSVKLLAAVMIAASLLASPMVAAPATSPYDTKLMGEMAGKWKGVGPLAGVTTTIILTVFPTQPGAAPTTTMFQELIDPANPVNFEQGNLKLVVQDQITLEVLLWTPQVVTAPKMVGNVRMPQTTPVPQPIPTMWNVKFVTPNVMEWQSLQGLPPILFQRP